MANSTDHQLPFNGSTKGLPGDSFGGPNNAPDSLPAGGIIFSSANYGMMLTLALSGYLAGRVGTKRVVGVSLFASSLLSILTALAAELGLVSLIAARIVQSLIQGSTFGGQYALWEKWGPPTEQSRLCSIGLSGMMLGTFTIILLGGIICQTLGWPFAFYILGKLRSPQPQGFLQASGDRLAERWFVRQEGKTCSLCCGLCLRFSASVWGLAETFQFSHGSHRGFAYIAAILAPTVNGFLLNQAPEFGWRNVFLLLFAINLPGLIFYLIFGEAVVQDWAKERKLTHL
ncbi:hypothetical protein GH733_016765 [Mirounga leonina]|nr:hypothetical protein GH733_016765 [Mirounga leonina]